jgi:hypothetical protein
MTGRYLTAGRLRELEVVLTDRDVAVLQRVAELRFVSGDQLTRLCFVGSSDAEANARAARRALLRLVKLTVLARLPRSVGGVRAGSAGFVYHLGIAGQRLATGYGWQPERRARRSLTPGSLFLRHTLAVAELHTRLTEGDRAGRFELLTLDNEPACWRQWDGLAGQGAVLKPDSFVRLGLGPYEDNYFIEVDRGTEGSRALDRQVGAYVAYYQSGREQTDYGVFPKVLWMVPDRTRSAALGDVIAGLSSDERALFTVALFADAVDAMSGGGTDAATHQINDT